MDQEEFVRRAQEIEAINGETAEELYTLMDAYDAIKQTRHEHLWVKVGDPDGRVVTDETLRQVKDAIHEADLPFKCLITGWDLHPEAYEDADELLEHVEREIKQT